VTREIRIEGHVKRGDSPVAGAYVRLIAPSGEFVAELRTDESGAFRFYPIEGEWTLVSLIPGGDRTEQTVTLAPGESAEIDLEL
jgi:putative component of toxin-antitoxin plasmid stabilization module